MRINTKALIDVFTGWRNIRARDIANDLGNRTADKYSISLVEQALGKIEGLKGVFELATHAFSAARGSGATGRSFKPFLLSRAPR